MHQQGHLAVQVQLQKFLVELVCGLLLHVVQKFLNLLDELLYLDYLLVDFLEFHKL